MHIQLHWHETLESTNIFLKEWVQRDPDVPTGTVVAARRQTRGRGRMGRGWISNGKPNVTASLWCRTRVPPKASPSSAMAVALGVADFLRTQEVQATLKWPNDVQVGGKKISGILAERLPGGLVLGMGLNVNLDRTDHIDQPATSMRLETGQTYDVELLLPGLLEKVGGRLDQWLRGGFSALRADWEKGHPGLGRNVSLREGNALRTGCLYGFGQEGQLILQESGGSVREIWAGDLTSGSLAE